MHIHIRRLKRGLRRTGKYLDDSYVPKSGSQNKFRIKRSNEWTDDDNNTISKKHQFKHRQLNNNFSTATTKKKSTHYGMYLHNGERGSEQVSSSVAYESTTVKESTATATITFGNSENRIITSNGDKGTQKKRKKEKCSIWVRKSRKNKQANSITLQFIRHVYCVCVCVSFHWSFFYYCMLLRFSYTFSIKISCAFSGNSNFIYWQNVSALIQNGFLSIACLFGLRQFA